MYGCNLFVIKVAYAAIKHFDRIDLLVNSAGIYIAKPFTEYTPADFELMIGTNVAGYFFITQRVVMQMRKQKSDYGRGALSSLGRLLKPNDILEII